MRLGRKWTTCLLLVALFGCCAFPSATIVLPGDGECSVRTGAKLLQQIFDKGVHLCPEGPTQVILYQPFDDPKDGNLVEMQEVMLDLTKIDFPQQFSWQSSGANGHPTFHPGALVTSCAKARQHLPQRSLEEGKLISSLWKSRTDYANQTCDIIVHTPTVLLMRFEAWNLYHQLGEFLNVYVSLLATSTLAQARIMFLDSHGDTYKDVYQLFSKQKPLFWLKEWHDKRVCFDKLLIPPQGYQSFNQRHLQKADPCISEVIQSFAYYVKSSFDTSRQAPPRVVVTFSVRRNYMGRVIDRQIPREAEIIAMLERSIAKVAQFSVVNFAEIPVKEQVQVVANTDVLVGWHGAGLTHLIFLPPEAVVIEIDALSRRHFKNLARNANKLYFQIDGSTSGLGEKLTDKIIEAVQLAGTFNSRSLRKVTIN